MTLTALFPCQVKGHPSISLDIGLERKSYPQAETKVGFFLRCDEKVESIDFVSYDPALVLTLELAFELNNLSFEVVACYGDKWSYAHPVVDLVKQTASREQRVLLPAQLIEESRRHGLCSCRGVRLELRIGG